jgi:hypothetical protein
VGANTSTMRLTPEAIQVSMPVRCAFMAERPCPWIAYGGELWEAG